MNLNSGYIALQLVLITTFIPAGNTQLKLTLIKQMSAITTVTLAVLVLVATCAIFTNAKQYMRCEMSIELVQKYKFDKTLLSNWVCMIEHESARDTSKVTKKPNGSSRYGLFQISSKEWCKEGRKGGICNVKCESFVDENISDDVVCVKKVFERDGFKHWAGWNQTCRTPINLPNLNVACRI